MGFADSRSGFDTGDIFGDCIDIVRRNGINFYLLSVIGGGIPNFFTQFVQRQTMTNFAASGGANGAATASALGKVGGLLLQTYSLATLAGLFGIFIQAMMIVAAVDDAQAQPMDLSTMVGRGMRFFPACLGLSIIWYLTFCVGLFLFIVPGVIIGCAWSVILPAYASEQLTLGEALSRSAKLTKGLRWSVLGVWLLYFVIAIIIGGSLSAAIGLAFGSGLSVFAGQGSPLGGALGTATVATLFLPVQTSLMVAIFNALRRAKEQVTPRSIVEAFT